MLPPRYRGVPIFRRSFWYKLTRASEIFGSPNPPEKSARLAIHSSTTAWG
jgi:hypothetical protein